MSIEVKVPRLPESVADATLVTWHKNPGDRVARDENLADLETDKVVLEVPAPAAGVLGELKVKGGTTVTSGQLLAVIQESGAGAEAKPSPASEPEAAPAGGAVAAGREGGNGEASSSGRLSPAVRRLVQEHELDPASISGSGRGGRILKSDVLAALEEDGREQAGGAGLNGDEHARAADDDADDSTAIALAPVMPAQEAARQDRRERMSRLRARIAERMVEAQQNAAMLSTFNEVDLSEVMALRRSYGESFEKKHGVRLGFMGFFVQAVVEGLRRFPVLNASVEGDEIVYHEYHDIGIAVSTERGLIVPVLRDADQLGLAEVEQTITEFGQKARAGSISMDELTGGTFTITNGGIFGSMLSTPILNPPQSGILGMHRIQERPVVVDSQIVIRPMMYLALTYDHRIVDGREAVQFLVAVREVLEDPRRLLLQV
ncbi:MAG: 2-oxoglutarate dehydrogenase complex dihydrolipoyllysine-residue succinyltransferase [Chromatiales bacterium]|nr:2-oxoglutarate dehydrogenase complex dihydrolipoyllysine-residue succinyltransferase [Chromatiales bacterium]